MDDMDDLIADFLVECVENLDRFEQDLLALEERPTDAEVLDSLFRAIHTIKGSAGFLEMTNLATVTHAGESLLSHLRDGLAEANGRIVGELLTLADAVRLILGSLEAGDGEGDTDNSALVARLDALRGAIEAGEDLDEACAALSSSDEATQASQGAGEGEPTDAMHPEVQEAMDDDLVSRRSEATPPHEEAPEADHVEATVFTPTPNSATQVANDTPKTDTATQVAKKTPATKVTDTTIRVDVRALDGLMNMVGELVLARNQLVRLTTEDEESPVAIASASINRITTQLQQGIMKTRMQPIGNVLSKLPRLVRDVAGVCGKKVKVEIEGAETELDRSLLEAIKDPLIHIVRNSVDHGIERPEDRVTIGKPEDGRILFRAYHQDGNVNIEIIDDGKGVDVPRVKARAVERGLITQAQANAMSDREAAQLLFVPGFSTAEKVTSVSGRGVGMDVVRTNIEEIGGSIDLSSERGVGTTCLIRIPLTLAIMPALVVESGGHRFAIPQVNLLELVHLEGGVESDHIEHVHNTPVYRLRGSILPILDLGDLLEINLASKDICNPDCKESTIVVMQSGIDRFGLVVDEVLDTEEIVVKPLGSELAELTCYAGATIMGDGKVALILDIPAIARSGGVTRDGQVMAVERPPATTSTPPGATTPLLLVRGANQERLAIPLDQVARLEEFHIEAVEPSLQGPVVQYRKEIMPLVSLDGRRFVPSKAGASIVSVIVHDRDPGSVGVVVEEIEDIAESALPPGHGHLSSVVVAGRVANLVHLAELTRCVSQEAA